jgi:hypothetical protein
MNTRTKAARTVGVAAVLATGWAFGGTVGLVTTAIALPIAVVVGPRLVAAGAFASLLVAALATIFEVWPTSDFYADFAQRRPIAAEAGRVAGLLLFVSLVISAYRERSRTPVTRPTSHAPCDDT